jgi:hypothetical protein
MPNGSTNAQRLAQAAKLDRAVILAATYERNRVRRDAGLPLLDVRVEFDHAVGQELDRAFEALLKPIMAEFDHKLSLRWIARWQRKNKTDRWPSGMGISLLMGRHCRKVFKRVLRMRTGIVAPIYNARHLTRYGVGS